MEKRSHLNLLNLMQNRGTMNTKDLITSAQVYQVSSVFSRIKLRRTTWRISRLTKSILRSFLTKSYWCRVPLHTGQSLETDPLARFSVPFEYSTIGLRLRNPPLISSGKDAPYNNMKAGLPGKTFTTRAFKINLPLMTNCRCPGLY